MKKTNMRDSEKECMAYVARWYAGDVVLTIEMDGSGNALEEQCIQSVVIMMLRDFITHPIPDGFKEGSQEMGAWMVASLQRATDGATFEFTVKQVDAIINLAFNYWRYGIDHTQSDPAVRYRLIKMSKHWPGAAGASGAAH